jgi:hypothetical protein
MKDKDSYINDYILRQRKGKQMFFLFLKISIPVFIAFSLLLSVYHYFNPEPCPNERVQRVYNMQFDGHVTGYSLDCFKSICNVYFKADTVQLAFYDLNVGNYNLNLEDEYQCLSHEIEVNDRIVKLKNNYKIMLIKPNGKRLEYELDCATKYCPCKVRSSMPSDFETYTSI